MYKKVAAWWEIRLGIMKFDLCFGFFFGMAARGALQDVKRERPTSRFAAV